MKPLWSEINRIQTMAAEHAARGIFSPESAIEIESLPEAMPDTFHHPIYPLLQELITIAIKISNQLAHTAPSENAAQERRTAELRAVYLNSHAIARLTLKEKGGKHT